MGLFPKYVMDELPDFDDSGVQRAPLVRTTLVAAHLAQTLSYRPMVRAGLAVEVPGRGIGHAAFWAGTHLGWHISLLEAEEGTLLQNLTSLEDAVRLLPVDAEQMLALLPTPPGEDRFKAALAELRDLGAMATNKVPSVLGAACLKLPVD